MSPSAPECPVCGACRPGAYAERDGIRFLRCGVCGSIYQADPPDWARLESLYESGYHAARGHADNPSVELAKRATMRAYLRRLAAMQPAGRRLLEVGCSTGVGLEVAAKSGWNVTGVEISKEAARQARERAINGAVYASRLEGVPLPEASQDVVLMFDVLEHIEPPAATLSAAFRLLARGGLLLIVTPNATSLSARCLRSRWPHLFAEHVVLFSPLALRRLLESVGFRVERAGFAWKRVNLEMLVRHARLHTHVIGGALLRAAGRVVPKCVQRLGMPFNLGEFYMVARRP